MQGVSDLIDRQSLCLQEIALGIMCPLLKEETDVVCTLKEVVVRCDCLHVLPCPLSEANDVPGLLSYSFDASRRKWERMPAWLVVEKTETPSGVKPSTRLLALSIRALHSS